jgi:Uma2 family endonuclease
MNVVLPPSEIDAAERLFDVGDLLAMSAAGLFGEGENVELIDGRLVVAPSEGSAHFGVNGAIIEVMTALARDLGDVRYYVNATVELTTRRVLNPDGMMLAKGVLNPPALPGPADVKLVIEVADRSIAYDEGAKKRLYAEAGAAELWIVRVPQQDLHVLRRPVDGLYLDEQILRPGEAIAPLFAPNHPIEVAALFDI